jgi:FtsZ-binding cell division protein ZapB
MLDDLNDVSLGYEHKWKTMQTFCDIQGRIKKLGNDISEQKYKKLRIEVMEYLIDFLKKYKKYEIDWVYSLSIAQIAIFFINVGYTCPDKYIIDLLNYSNSTSTYIQYGLTSLQKALCVNGNAYLIAKTISFTNTSNPEIREWLLKRDKYMFQDVITRMDNYYHIASLLRMEIDSLKEELTVSNTRNTKLEHSKSFLKNKLQQIRQLTRKRKIMETLFIDEQPSKRQCV